MPPPIPAPRMTANPIRPGRYRPGKAIAEEQSSDEEEEEGEEETDTTEQATSAKKPPPKASSFPKGAVSAAPSLKSLDLNERRRQDQARERARIEEERREREHREREAGFVTESEADSLEEEEDEEDDDNERGAPQARPQRQRQEASGSEESDSDEEDDSSDSDAVTKPMLRPVFMKKAARTTLATSSVILSAAAQAEPDRIEAEAARKRETNNALIQSRIDAEAALKAAGSRAWDEVDLTGEGGATLDDTDGLNTELEHQEWVARELARVKRSRAALEEREAELAEIERRRNLSTPEREEEDRRRLAEQKDAKDSKGKAGFMAKYHHRGAFFGDEEDKEGNKLAERDLMGAEYEGRVQVMEALPKYLQVRDQTMVGRKGRQRHKDLKSEDTGRWGDLGDRRGGKGGGAFVQDDRFRPDRPGEGGGRTGANATIVGDRDRKRLGEGSREDDSKRIRMDVS